MAFKPPHGALGNAKNNPKNHQRSKMTQTRAETARSTQFFSSLLVIGEREFGRWNSFVVGMATKIGATSQSALEEFIARDNLTMTVEQTKAIRALGSSR